MIDKRLKPSKNIYHLFDVGTYCLSFDGCDIDIYCYCGIFQRYDWVLVGKSRNAIWQEFRTYLEAECWLKQNGYL